MIFKEEKREKRVLQVKGRLENLEILATREQKENQEHPEKLVRQDTRGKRENQVQMEAESLEFQEQRATKETSFQVTIPCHYNASSLWL